MSRRDSKSTPHGRHDPIGGKNTTHHHHSGSAQASDLSQKDKLIIRLQHTLQHNQEHAETYRRMAEEATDLGEEEAAHLIRDVAEETARQIGDLEQALAALKSARGRGGRG